MHRRRCIQLEDILDNVEMPLRTAALLLQRRLRVLEGEERGDPLDTVSLALDGKAIAAPLLTVILITSGKLVSLRGSARRPDMSTHALLDPFTHSVIS